MATMPNAAASLQTAKVFSHWMEGKKSKLLGHGQALRSVLVCSSVPAVQWLLVMDVGDAFLGANNRADPWVPMGFPMPLVDLCTIGLQEFPQSREIHAGKGLAFMVEFGCFYRSLFLPVVM